MPKKVLCAMPYGLLEQIDFVAHVEHRTRSDLIREALRRYIDDFKRQCVSIERASSIALAPAAPQVRSRVRGLAPLSDGNKLVQLLRG